MRAVVQRVRAARVLVDDEVVGELDLAAGRQGLVLLVGVTHSDTEAQARALAEKVWRLSGTVGSRSSKISLSLPRPRAASAAAAAWH